jgi:hypothetical protein
MESGLQPYHYYYLTVTSNFTLLSIYYSYMYEYYISTVLSTCVLLTSLNYWRYPLHGFRRNLDCIVVRISIGTQSILMVHKENFIIYFVINVVAYLCYRYGQHLRTKKMLNQSVFCHSMLHLLANVANVILYTGNKLFKDTEVIVHICQKLEPVPDACQSHLFDTNLSKL